jgi:hypothetical protein
VRDSIAQQFERDVRFRDYADLRVLREMVEEDSRALRRERESLERAMRWSR